MRGRGIDIVVRDGSADILWERGILTLSYGRPRFPGRHPLPQETGTGAARAWLTGYLDKGEEILQETRGPFAVVIIDLARAFALLATDRFGICPLCFSTDGSRLALSDRADRVPTQGEPILDHQGLFDYLYFHFIPAPRTSYRGVFRVPGAHIVTFDGHTPRFRRHWNPVFEERSDVPLSDLGEEFRGLVRQAVKREADGTAAGCFLSGGTDSSTVCGFLGEITGKPAQTYSIGFDAQGYDEMAYARIAARHFGAEHHEYYLTPEDLIEAIPKVAGQYDQPFGNSSALPAYYCANLAGRDGLERLLAGDGGDELFGGNTRYATQKVFGAYTSIPFPLRHAIIEPLLLSAPGLARVPALRKLISYVCQARTPMPDRMNGYNLLVRLGATAVLETDFLATIDAEAPVIQERMRYQECPSSSLVNRMLFYDWKFTLADNDLPKVCGTSGLADIDVGFPLLADEIVDFSLRLAPSLKVRGLRLRYFFKRALRGFLPDEILRKKKHGFGLPFGLWLADKPELAALAKESLRSLSGRGWVQRTFVEDLLEHRVREHPAYYGEMVWILMMLEQWLKSERARTRSALTF